MSELGELSLLGSAFYPFPRVRVEKGAFYKLLIDTRDTGITSEIICRMTSFKTGKIRSLELHNKALYCLRKMVVENRAELYVILLDPKDSDINYEILRDMDNIEVDQNSEFNIRLYDKALYLLEKVKAPGGITRLEIDIQNSDLGLEVIKNIRRIGEMKFESLSLYHKAIYLWEELNISKDFFSNICG
eukprot:GHVP01021454.1.p1 GENE.GHVP01021454.1~~GHVP01021454.1.p1  ORF type:complete len:188 (+),score=33.71 GHVP01021454.1:379-942(+)